MDQRLRKIAAFAGAAVLAGGVGVAVASQGGDDTGSRAALTQAMPGQSGQGAVPGQSQDGQSGQGAVPGQGGMPGGPPGTGGAAGGPDLGTLAAALGVSTDELQTALRDIRPEPPAQSGVNPLVAALAAALDLPESKVAAALEAVRPSGAPDDGTAPPSGTTPPSGTAPPSGSGGGTTGTRRS